MKITHMISATLCCASMIMAPSAHAAKPDEAKVVYVGGGRNVCHGNAAQCAQIEENNRAQEERERRRYEDDQRRANEYVRESRHREQDSRNRY